jgi:hypothetical protein
MDTEPLGSTITSSQKEDVVAKDPEMISASVTGITSLFNEYGNTLSTSYHCDFGYPAVMMWLDSRGTDLVGLNTGYNWFSYPLTFDDVIYTNYGVTMIWKTFYNQIYAANQVASAIDAETEDPTSQFYLAQALAIRAFDYFGLAQLFQHTYKGHESSKCVPLITNENANEAAANGCARSTVEEVYAQILKDLDNAISLLESSGKKRSDKRYVSKEVAYGLRARVNLTMQNWSDAASDAQKAIDGSGAPYSIEEVSAPGFNNIEDHSWMWGVLVAETDDVTETVICNFPSHMGSLCYGYASVGAWRKVNKKLYASIPDTDIRKGWFLDAYGESANLSEAQVAQVEEYGCPAYTQVKYGPYNNVMGQTVNASDVPLMRVEEMYLILAEAQAMGGNPSQGATTLQNFVQTYRDPSYKCTASSAADVQDAVWLQRRIELWGEGISYFDLMRLNKGVDRRGGGFEAECVFNIAAGDDRLIYRIPESEEQANVLISASDNNPVTTIPSPVADN